MHVIEINETAALGQFRDPWTSLLDNISDPSTVFVNPGWVIEWWKQFGGDKKLCILLLVNDGILVGVAPFAIWPWPFYSSPVRVLRLIGHGTSDHLDVCIHPEYQTSGILMLCEYIQKNIRWHAVDFLDIPEDSSNLEKMRSLLSTNFHPTFLLPAIDCPYLIIDSVSWSQFYSATRSKSTRKDLERRKRRLSELGHLEIRRYETPADISSVFPKLFSLYEKRWKDKFLSASFASDRERRFYPEMALDFARQGRLDLQTLELNEQPLAFSLGVIHNNRFTWLITAHDPEYSKYFPGELMLIALLQSTFERGDITEFDFTRGEEDYKYKWANDERRNMRLLVARPSPFGIMPLVATSGYHTLRRIAKRSALLRRVKLELLGKLRSTKTFSESKAR